MNTTTRHFFLALFFSIFTGFGLWIVERMEGSKITTSEYIDVSYFFIAFGSILAFPFYYISFFLLATLVEKVLNNNLYAKGIGYAAIGWFCGTFTFGYEDRFIEGYGLQIETSILTFIVIGLLLASIDRYILKNKSIKPTFSDADALERRLNNEE